MTDQRTDTISDVVSGNASVATRQLELRGTGRNLFWAVLSPLVLTASSFFLLSYNIRQLGASEYGAIITINSLTAILTLFSSGLRYAVQHFDATATAGLETDEHIGVRATHSVFCAGGLMLIFVAITLGWVVNLDLGIHGAEAANVYLTSVLLVASAAILVATSTYAGLLTSREQFGTLARVAIAGFIVQVSLTVTLVPIMGIIGLAIAALGGSLVQAIQLCLASRKIASWMPIVPELTLHGMLRPITRYSGGIIILSFTSVVSSASDAFIIGAARGGVAVSLFRVGSTAPIALTQLMYTSLASLFPRLVRSPTWAAQEEGIAWLGSVVGWASGIAFGSVALLAPDIVKILLGHSSFVAVHVLWVTTGALAVDVSYHGVVQVIFARGYQGRLAKFTWVELAINLAATTAFVIEFGAFGSALALAVTIFAMDIIGFPLMMRTGRRLRPGAHARIAPAWGSPAGRFVLQHGVLQTGLAASGMFLLCDLPIRVSSGLVYHIGITVAGAIATTVVGYILLGSDGRRRLRTLLSRSVPVQGYGVTPIETAT